MYQMTAGLILGILSLHYWPSMPDYIWLITAMIIGGAIFLYLRIVFVLVFALGGLWAWWHAADYGQTVNRLPQERENITIVGEVRSLINHNILDNRFHFFVKSVKERDLLRKENMQLHLDWPEGPVLRQGQDWQLTVRVRRPSGRVNLAGFDAERYALGAGIHGTGTVLSGELLSAPDSVSLRQRFYERALRLTEGLTHQAYLLALSFGERDGLGQDDWVMLRDSGLAHLMAISGLHIGLVVAMGWWLGGRIRGGLPESNWLGWLPLWLALGLACGYAWLAGFSIPTQRALLMSAFCLLLIRCGIVWDGLRIWLVVLAVCLLLDPLASYSAGLWLSFGAVLVLYLANTGGIRRRKGMRESLPVVWRETLRVYALLQLILLGLMLPFQWIWFGGISPLSPLMNLMAVPWVSLVTVPLVLAAVSLMAFPSLSGLFWQWADHSITPVVWLGELAVGGWWPLSETVFAGLLIAVAAVMIGWFLPWRQFVGLQLSLLIALLGIRAWYQQQVLPPQDWRIDMLDVGHGLAVLIQRQERAVLYDTGIRWPGGSMVLSVIEPVLRAQGITRLDGLILSHADADHAGGAQDAITRLNPDWQRSSDHRARFAPCVRGQAWRWQDLSFRVLWPPKRVARAGNPHSCVVEVSDRLLNPDAVTTVLLTGDIDAISELLLAKLEPRLKADILLVPHHGSQTSSTQTWLQSLDMRYALVSTGRYSPWPLPSAQVKARYLSRGIDWLDTAENGQIRLRIHQGQIDVVRYRQDIRRGWYQTLFRPSSVDCCR
ncbi:DNA internalization-related competence protein ComEC/Rec2 [Photobacterium sp. GJ3]|nr:DNA internalization-related competence protein ComEC/Rec2 [Photobacterium sp. GJ3]QUJ66274.1 DNA internalization-related competence protein ComEC/Rec2 [Photobacterium sp. GJ3]